MDANGASKTATPWGAAKLIDELPLPQRAGEKRFASVVQLLEAPRGERPAGRRGAGRSPCVYATSSACEQRLRSIPTWRRCCGWVARNT